MSPTAASSPSPLSPASGEASRDVRASTNRTKPPVKPAMGLALGMPHGNGRKGERVERLQHNDSSVKYQQNLPVGSLGVPNGSNEIPSLQSLPPNRMRRKPGHIDPEQPDPLIGHVPDLVRTDLVNTVRRDPIPCLLGNFVNHDTHGRFRITVQRAGKGTVGDDTRPTMSATQESPTRSILQNEGNGIRTGSPGVEEPSVLQNRHERLSIRRNRLGTPTNFRCRRPIVHEYPLTLIQKLARLSARNRDRSSRG